MRALLAIALLSGFAQAATLSVFVDSLGASDDARLLRDKLVAELIANREVQVVTSRERAHALISGSGRMIEGTVITEMALRLTDAHDNVLWGFDSGRCPWGFVRGMYPNVPKCAAGELTKAMRKDRRLSDANLPDTIPVGSKFSPEEAARVGAKVEQALAASKQRHPDFADYDQAMNRISKRVPPGDLSPEEYIEMLYTLAKAEKKSTF